ncbi:hypothetical protein TBLA_0G02750 [Henningerozyma blattae CBS 6284]|uniref:5'-3' exoribonuclease 1 n=1 Tax=Henningerozyma blattae (strain ATCC 34711 / CBS 6284 / DSM 70876 / NBRC 10599 / NRRL Y-10934 / UCD 77-7) TaxID=1071380 RepID=I2H761_HENB6|nr:hypothetical protein TBLA_0G02750 [Tetrapisispora blattae CBS 6284]CCH62213.1 hypothetical protein TBLA_0G02750 [Tetrapisispora blattae CBS 6284]
MGIPKFFRYISERWPMILQLIEGNQIPEFDNLYLDMNSILHTCTHSNDDSSDITKRLSEEEVFAKIFTYIDHLFMTIKPKQTFYMAIDGVAPRAKMNQQRARRFRTAMDAEKALQKAIEEGTEIPKGEPFDSNSITPGTEFMAKLTKNLKYFIHDKISNDSNWRNVEIVFSGHEVPGEGEHKIMDYIRTIRSQEGYNPNTRHCIYGLDADLIILGLSTHAPHFALLREEVKFGRRSGQTPALENQNFFLLHLSLLREYLELEFENIADELQFEYNFERVLDDFILILFVIGNDFLPNLPDLHLNKGAFPVLLQTFKEALLHLDGYINEFGKINLQRLKIWLEYLTQFELMNFEQKDIDVDWFNQQLENISIEGERKRARIGKKLILKQQKKIIGMIKPWILKEMQLKFAPDIADEEIPSLSLNSSIVLHDLDSDSEEDSENANTKNIYKEKQNEVINQNIDFLKKAAFDLGLIVVHSNSTDTYSLRIDVDAINPNETEEEHEERLQSIRRMLKTYQSSILVDDQSELDREQQVYEDRFKKWKNEYYKDKLQFTTNTDEGKQQLKKLSCDYVEGLQWVLFYYYKGCQSWSWYYPHHYSPRISDLILGLHQVIDFEKSVPFTPFQQLMAVLPERSKNLIPVCLRPLMYEENSKIIDFYPHEVKLDKNGKTAEWEAVVLLSFIDEKRLIDAMEPYLSKLSPEEKIRNSFGRNLTFTFNPQIDEVYKSPLSGIFKDLEHNHCVEKEHKTVSMDGKDYVYGLLPDAKFGQDLLAGFPTLATIPFDYKLEYNESMVFQQASRQQSMVLSVNNIYKETNLSLSDISKRYLGKVIYTRWPYLRESKLLAISDGKTIYESDERVSLVNVNPLDHYLSSFTKNIKISSRPMKDTEKKQFNSLQTSLARKYLKQQAVNIGELTAIIEVLPVTGLVRNQEGAYVKTYSSTSEYFPLQLMVRDIQNKDERYAEKPPQPIEEEFPRGSEVIFLGDYAYGGKAIIDDYSSKTRLKLTVEKKLSKFEPHIGKERLKLDNEQIKYYPSYVISKKLNLHPLFLSKILSKFLIAGIDGKHINVGIPIKFESRHEKVLGYARRNPKGWEFSNIAVSLLEHYRDTFKEFFAKLSKNKDNIPSIESLFPNYSPKQCNDLVSNITEFLKTFTANFVKVSIESDSLTKVSISAVEDYVERYSKQEPKPEQKHLAKVPRDAILDPKTSFSLLRTQKFSLGDRVVYIQDSGKVPLFSKGTVVGYTTLGSTISVQVLFDHEIVAGNKFGGRLRTNRGLGLDASFLLNITDRQFIYHSKASKKVNEDHKQANSKSITNQMLQEKVTEMKTKKAKNLLNHIKKGGKQADNKDIEEEESFQEKITAPQPKTISYRALINNEVDATSIIDSSTRNEKLPKDITANNVYSAVLNQIRTDGYSAEQDAGPISTQINQNGLPYQLPPGMAPHAQMLPGNFHAHPMPPPPPGFPGVLPPINMQGIPHFPPPNMMFNANHLNGGVDEKGSAELKEFIKGNNNNSNRVTSKKTKILKRPENSKTTTKEKYPYLQISNHTIRRA